MLTLNTLNSTSKKRKRVGRGGSRGGTSGKGHKGQKARSGGSVRIGFEGGQMPLFRRLPKRGFSNARFTQDYEIVGLDAISKFFDDGAQVTKDALIKCGLVRAAKGQHAVKVKVLAGSSFSKKLVIQADKFSKTAQEMITSNGGEAHTIKEN